jgi:PKD repeat protein
VIASHAYPVAGTYPLVLTVVDAQGAAGAAATTVTVGATTQALITARAGGPYAGTAGVSVSFDGSTSTVPSGATAKYSWTFGDDIVLHSPSFKTIKGRWRSVSLASAAGGTALENSDAGDAKISTALSAPANYIEATFRAAAGVPYRLWLRMRALNDSYSNDSIHVQFSGSVTSTGAATTRIGSTSALGVVLEEGRDAGVSGWGWADASYGGLAAPIYFNSDGTQTIRIQQREDGVQIDQVVVSATEHFLDAPGLKRGDSTIVPLFGPDATGAQTGHVYRAAGVYPVTLTVDAGSAGTGTSTTTATVK